MEAGKTQLSAVLLFFLPDINKCTHKHITTSRMYYIASTILVEHVVLVSVAYRVERIICVHFYRKIDFVRT